MREVSPLAAHLPQALVRLVPVALQEVHEDLLYSPSVVGWLDAVPAGGMEGIHDIAVDIDLELCEGRVAGADRAAALVAAQPGQLVFLEAALADAAVHDLPLRGLAGDRPQPPFPPGAGPPRPEERR